MLRNAAVQLAAVLGVGALLGYVAASPRFSELGPAYSGGPLNAVSTTQTYVSNDAGAAHDETNSQLVAMADPKSGPDGKTKEAATQWPRLPAQEVLPFPPTPSASLAGRTMQDSVYKQPEPHRLPTDAPRISSSY